jgi:glycosyltransferase involved in cell wall biosynthesis
MIDHQKVVVIMPAYNAERTLLRTYEEVPHDLVDEVILTDDFSSDRTTEIARRLDLTLIEHDENRGYGGNQKTCYQAALEAGADIVIMLHPDYQYTPKLIPAMAHMVACGEYDVVLGSRILTKGALAGGMPIYKYISNRFLTFVQNLLVRHKLSEYHTGYRAFRRRVLEDLPLAENSDDFVFDNQILVQGYLLRLPHRGGQLPGLLRAGFLKHRLPSQPHLRAGGAVDLRAVRFATAGGGALRHLRPQRPSARALAIPHQSRCAEELYLN